MTRGDVLKGLIKGSDMDLMVSIGGVKPIDAKLAIKIWEHLNMVVDPQKQDPQKQEPEKAEGKRKKLDDGKMLALRKAGWSYEKIADEMGCSTPTVINHIRERERQ